MIAIIAACAAAVIAPAVMLLWMPIVLGVAHVANDVRFLVAPLPRAQRGVAALACGALVIARACALAAPALQLEAAIVAGWLVVAVAIAGRRRSAIAWAALAGTAIAWHAAAFVVIATLAHGAIAIAMWLALARPRRRRAVATVAAIVVVAAIALGIGAARAAGGDAAALDRAAAAFVPGVAPAVGRVTLVVFAFVQAIHYAIWLVWIPRDVAAPAWSRRARAAVVGVALVVIACGLVAPLPTRATYLALATFHVYVELVVAAIWLARSRR